MIIAFKPAGQYVEPRVTRLVNEMLRRLPDEWDAVNVYPRMSPGTTSDKSPAEFTAIVRVGSVSAPISFDLRFLRDPKLCANHLTNAARQRLGIAPPGGPDGS